LITPHPIAAEGGSRRLFSQQHAEFIGEQFPFENRRRKSMAQTLNCILSLDIAANK
jgi:hypothetical protein